MRPALLALTTAAALAVALPAGAAPATKSCPNTTGITKLKAQGVSCKSAKALTKQWRSRAKAAGDPTHLYIGAWHCQVTARKAGRYITRCTSKTAVVRFSAAKV